MVGSRRLGKRIESSDRERDVNGEEARRDALTRGERTWRWHKETSEMEDAEGSRERVAA